MEKVKWYIDIIHLTRRLNKLITKDFDNRLEEYGLTSHQGHILFYINRRVNIDGLETHQKDIEEEFRLSKSTVSGLIKRMEKNGLIVKIDTHPYYKLEPTEKGKQIIEQVRKGKQLTIERILDGFSEEDRERIQTNLIKMIKNMQEEEEDEDVAEN